MMQTFDIEHNRLFNELTATLKEDIVKIAGKCNVERAYFLFIHPETRMPMWLRPVRN